MPQKITSADKINFTPQNKPFPSPSDWRDQFIYFLLVDRFDDNKKNTDLYDSNKIDDSNSISGERDKKQGKMFQGGNLKGLTRRLDYIKDLGCTTIWLSPIFKNRQEMEDSYHGYGIQNFLEVDQRFGTMEDLRELVKKAHQKGMYVILDIILNHTGDNWAYPGDHPYYYSKETTAPFDLDFWRETNSKPKFQKDDAVWPDEFRKEGCYKRRGQIRDWNNTDEAIDGDFFSLKELNIKKPEVLDTLIKSYKYWISVADIDGFRIDTVKHMENSATAIFCNAIREYAKRIGKHNFFIFGEVVGDDVTLQKYIGRNSRIEGTNERFPSLDACLDFPLYFILEEVIKGFENSSSLRDRYERFKTLYADHGEAGRYFVTFVDNHDQISKHKRFMYDNPYPEQAVLAIGYLLLSQGVPCIYYGTEQGFDGGGDDDCYFRECMFGGKWGAFGTSGVHFFNKKNQIYKGIKAIAEARIKEPALKYGRQYFRKISGDGNSFGYPINGKCTLAFSRVLDTEEILVVMNLDSSDRQDYITVDKKLMPSGSKIVNLLDEDISLTVEDLHGRACVRVPLQGHQMAILKKI